MTEDLRTRIAEALSARFAAKNGGIDSIIRQGHYDTAGVVMTIVGPEVEGLRGRLAELENALTWQTSCTSCARTLDASVADHERAERAEAANSRALETLRIWRDERRIDPPTARLLYELGTALTAPETPS